MRKAILALVLIIPLCSGCATCAKILNFFLSDTNNDEFDRENARFEAWNEDSKGLEEKRSGTWNPSMPP